MSSRLLATKIIKQVLEDKNTLSNIFSNNHLLRQAGNEKALIQEMSYGAVRWYFQLEFILERLLDKPIKSKDSDLKYLLLIGLYQLIHMNIASHAVVSETVETCIKLNKQWAKGLVNAILRRYIREADTLIISSSDFEICSSHPKWLIDQIKHDWPEQWRDIINANNQRPPMYLRVNQLHQTREEYLKILQDSGINAYPTPYSEQGILLDNPIDVMQLPGFELGRVSVQELAAQFSAGLLDLHSGQNVLDACAAPGGKSGHILESTSDIESLTVIEKDHVRAKKLLSTLQRLRLNAKLKISDALDINNWWDKKKFDRILLDAPCSATGVIRRNPDIKVIRTPQEVDRASDLQLELLCRLWNLLKKKGLLLYATCSVLKQENANTIKQFSENHIDCAIKPIPVEWGIDTGYGRQILTGENNMDGFFMPALKRYSAMFFINTKLKTLGGLIFIFCFYITSHAKTIDIKSTHAYTEGDTYFLDASFNIELTEEAQKALRHGIALEIHTQFQLLLKRKWLWDKKVNEIILIHRLEHHPLTEDYLTINMKTGLRRSYDNLEAALNYINSISKMALFNKTLLHQKSTYLARIRTYIDLESLPSPMRPQAYFSSSWDMSSEWYEWEVIK